MSKPPKIDFDNNWKEAIEKHTYEAIAFFMPNLHAKIDTTRTPIFLEQEMRNLRRGTQKGRKKIMDKLIKVWLKTGEEQWILIHIEIESSDKEGFNKRMYIYFSRAFDKYDVAVVALALLVGENPPPSHDVFEQNFHGTELRYKYNAYIVAEQDEQELLKSENIFALFILANLYTIQTKNDMKRRLKLKKKIHELALERNISLETMNSLLTFVFEILTLPINEAKKYQIFKDKKQKEMTDTAFKKRRIKTNKTLADSFTKVAYDMYPSEMIKALKEKDNVLKEKDNVLKEKEQSLNRLIIYLYTKEDKTVEAIASITELPLLKVRLIIESYNNDKNKP